MSTTADEAGSDTAQASVVVTGPTADVVTVQVSGGITTDAAGKVAQAFDTAMTASREGGVASTADHGNAKLVDRTISVGLWGESGLGHRSR